MWVRFDFFGVPVELTTEDPACPRTTDGGIVPVFKFLSSKPLSTTDVYCNPIRIPEGSTFKPGDKCPCGCGTFFGAMVAAVFRANEPWPLDHQMMYACWMQGWPFPEAEDADAINP